MVCTFVLHIIFVTLKGSWRRSSKLSSVLCISDYLNKEILFSETSNWRLTISEEGSLWRIRKRVGKWLSSNFELLSRYYVHIQANTLEKEVNPFFISEQ